MHENIVKRNLGKMHKVNDGKWNGWSK